MTIFITPEGRNIRCESKVCTLPARSIHTRAGDSISARKHAASKGWKTLTHKGRIIDVCPTCQEQILNDVKELKNVKE